MITGLYILLALVILAFLQWVFVKKAPFGYEDKTGFHYENKNRDAGENK